jgi:N6-adenosine-specific RNA methylase IME4/ParB-like chromosome segregation protein Spo0J
MTDIVILSQIEQALFPLREEELEALEDSIIKEGIRDPLIVWNNNGKLILVDGHNRYRIAQKHNLNFKVIEKSFSDLDEALNWIDKNQLGRRNLTDEQRAVIVGRMYERQKKAAHRPKLEENNVDKLSTFSGTAATAKSIAEKVGANEKTVRRSAEFVKALDKIKEIKPEATEKILKGEVKDAITTLPKVAKEAPELLPKVVEKIVEGETDRIKEAINIIKKEERIQDIERQKKEIEEGKIKLPEGVFEVIVVDPPWPYGTKYDPEGRRAANPYPEMSLEQIKNIKLPAAENCILFLWTTHKFMRYSFDILDTWGFRDVAIITWVKDRMGLGTWLRSQSEFCIMAVKGKPMVNLTNQTTVVYGPLREHSRKPDEFYQMVNELCIGRKLDYFSREQRDGWFTFGNDTVKFTRSDIA